MSKSNEDWKNLRAAFEKRIAKEIEHRFNMDFLYDFDYEDYIVDMESYMLEIVGHILDEYDNEIEQYRCDQLSLFFSDEEEYCTDISARDECSLKSQK